MSPKNDAAISLRIRLKYPDVESFIAKYAPNVSRGGIFIQSRTPQPVGTQLRFELVLHDGTRLLKGQGHVVWVKEYDAAQPTQAHGMGVRFSRLDPQSELMIERVLTYKTAATRRVAVEGSATQEVRRLAAHAAATEASEELLAAGPEPRAVLRKQATSPQPEAGSAAAAAPPPVETASPATVGGNGLTEICAWADEQLQQLLATTSLTFEQVETMLAEALASRPAVADLAELEALLVAEEPASSPDRDDARERLRSMLAWSVAPLSVAPPAPREPAGVVPRSGEPDLGQDAAIVVPSAGDGAATTEPAQGEPGSSPAIEPTAVVEPGGDDSSFEEFQAPVDDDSLGDMEGCGEEAAVDELELAEPEISSREPPPVRAPGDVIFASRDLESDVLQDLAREGAAVGVEEGTLSGIAEDTLGGRRYVTEVDEDAPTMHRRSSTQVPDDDQTALSEDAWREVVGIQRLAEGRDDPVVLQAQAPHGAEEADVTVDLTPEGIVPAAPARAIRDELLADPDLDHEVFEALAGERTARAASSDRPLSHGDEPAADPMTETDPSLAGPTETDPSMGEPTAVEEPPPLEVLANRARDRTPEESLAAVEPADSGGLDIVVEDEEAELQPAIRGHRSGLFRRLFGRKD